MKTLKKILFFFLGWFCSTIVLLLSEDIFPKGPDGKVGTFGALVIVFLPVIIGVLFVIRVYPNIEKSKSQQAPSANRITKLKLQLVSGLDLPSGSICSASLSNDLIEFSASGQTFSLPTDKLIDVSVMTPQEIQTQYVSSVGGAVAGAIFLGPLGAALGGAAKKKTMKNKKRFLVITYFSSETKYIVFDVTVRPQDGKTVESRYKSLKKADKIMVDL